MSAERLRLAANRLRTVISALDPWDGSDVSIGTWEEEFRTDSGNGTDAAYVRLMNPDVGLALADCLEEAAREVEESVGFEDVPVNPAWPPLRIADLILGGAS